jgi:tetratricopeptide (TPR) repeat protein
MRLFASILTLLFAVDLLVIPLLMQMPISKHLYHWSIASFDMLAGDYEGARENYDLALDHWQSGFAYMHRGLANYNSGHYSEARSDLEVAIDKNYHPDSAHRFLGLMEMNEGRYPEAERHLSTAWKLSDSDEPELLYLRALSRMHMGQPDFREDALKASEMFRNQGNIEMSRKAQALAR